MISEEHADIATLINGTPGEIAEVVSRRGASWCGRMLEDRGYYPKLSERGVLIGAEPGKGLA